MAARRNFNMVEMALALGVVAVGLISILALFPIGLNASRDAMATSYASDVAEQMIHQMEYAIRTSATGWNDYVIDTTVLSNIRPSATDLADFAVTVGTTPSFDNNGTGGTVFRNTSVAGVFKIYRYADNSSVGTPNQFDPADLIDFQVILAVWNEPVTIPPNPALLFTVATKLNVELSWPAQLPYAQRQKSFYSKELFKR